MFKKNKKKYYAWILQKQQGTYHRIGRKRINATTQMFKYKGLPFKINIQFNTFARGLKTFYFFDFNTKKQISIVDNKIPSVDADVYDMVFLKRIVKDLSSNLNNNSWKINLMTLFIGIALGGAFGFIIAGYV